MVRPILKTLGGKPKLVSAFGRDWRTVSSSCGVYVTLWDVLCTELTCGGPLCGELSGGKWTGGRSCEPSSSIDLPSVLSTQSDNTALVGCLGALLSAATLRGSYGQDSYLVDSASSHMLVSKIKPCMSKYKQSIP